MQGGIRTIYFYHAKPDAIYLLTAYAKADREDLSPADARTLPRGSGRGRGVRLLRCPPPEEKGIINACNVSSALMILFALN